MSEPSDRDCDHTQSILTGKLVRFLNMRGDIPVKHIIDMFYYNWQEALDWLGVPRQDAILKAAMRQTGVDLSEWITP